MGPKILIAGCGLTGSVAAAILRRELKGNCRIVVWDKEKGCGGRMLTSRSPQNSLCSVDLGAQYVTSTPRSSHAHKDFYNELISSGLLSPLSCRVEGMREGVPGARHFVSPEGTGSLVKHFLSAGSPNETQFGCQLQSLSILPGDNDGNTMQGRRWEAGNHKGGREEFDVVLITFPAPLVLRLEGDVAQIIESNLRLYDGLKSVTYSTRFVLALYYDDSEADIVEDWDAKFVDGDAIFRFVSIDNRKRGKRDQPASVVFHSTTTFGEQNADRSVEDVQVGMEKRAADMFPDWPRPERTKCHKWTYSQVLTSYPGQMGCVTVSQEPLLLLGGDSFAPMSNFDGCLLSAVRMAEAVLAQCKE